MSSFQSVLKSLRMSRALTQEDLAKSLKISRSTIGMYENGSREPDYEMLETIADFFNVDIDYLLGRTYKTTVLPTANSQPDTTPEEYDHIKKYRRLDDCGKSHVNSVLDWETARVAELAQQASKIKELKSANKEEQIPLRIYTYLRKIACAGNGFYFDDIPVETIEAPHREGADFIVGVNGDSMEPDFLDGDLVYVKKTDHLDYGDIGIFTINNDCYIKEFGQNGLISRNKNYSIITGDENVRLIGKVLDKVDEC